MQYFHSHLLARRSSSLLLLAAMLMSITTVFFAQPASAVAASRRASIFIKVAVTETKTTVGQQPKIIITYGNNGGVPLEILDGDCLASSALGPLLEITDATGDNHKLIPGQNDTVTLTTRAVSPGTGYVRCDIIGLYSDASGDHTVYAASNVVKVVVKAR